MAKSSLPKPRALTRERNGERYRVTLLGDYHANQYARPTVWPIQTGLTAPRLIYGQLMPANVRIEGLENVIELTVDVVKLSPTLSRFGCTRLEIKPAKVGGAVGKVDYLPLDTFVRDVVELATLECIAYPPDYEGELYATAAMTVTYPNMRLKVDSDEIHIEPIGWLNSMSEAERQRIAKFVAQPRANGHSPERDKVVRNAWLEAARNGEKVERYVEEKLAAAGYVVSIHNVRQLIKRAKDLGLIPRTIQEVRK